MSDNDNNYDGEAKSFYPRTNSCEDNDINNDDDDDNVTEDECTVALIIIEENDDVK